MDMIMQTQETHKAVFESCASKTPPDGMTDDEREKCVSHLNSYLRCSAFDGEHDDDIFYKMAHKGDILYLNIEVTKWYKGEDPDGNDDEPYVDSLREFTIKLPRDYKQCEELVLV